MWMGLVLEKLIQQTRYLDGSLWTNFVFEYAIPNNKYAIPKTKYIIPKTKYTIPNTIYDKYGIA